jgi:hypothetical protein
MRLEPPECAVFLLADLDRSDRDLIGDRDSRQRRGERITPGKDRSLSCELRRHGGSP